MSGESGREVDASDSSDPKKAVSNASESTSEADSAGNAGGSSGKPGESSSEVGPTDSSGVEGLSGNVEDSVAAGRSRKRRWPVIVLAAVVAIVALLAVNAVLVSRTTAEATGDQIIRLPDGDLHVVEDGPREAPAVLLIHGYAGSTAWWDPVVPALAETNHVIRVDLLGHGQSAKPADGYDIPAQGRRVGAVLDALGVAQATVVGHSMGGVVATALVEQRPELVRALAIIDSPSTPDSSIRQGLTTRLVKVPVLGQLLWRFRTDGAIRDGLDTAFTRDIDLPDAVIDSVRATTYTSFTAAARESRAYLSERSLPDRLATFTRPILVLFGDADQRVHPDSVNNYRTLPTAIIHVLPGTGHTPMLETPTQTVDLLRTFIPAT